MKNGSGASGQVYQQVYFGVHAPRPSESPVCPSVSSNQPITTIRGLLTLGPRHVLWAPGRHKPGWAMAQASHHIDTWRPLALAPTAHLARPVLGCRRQQPWLASLVDFAS